MGLGLLYTRLALRPEDEVLTTEHDFYATHESLRLSGVRVRRIALYDDARRASEDEIVSRVRRAVTGRTRVVALTWVHSSNGVPAPGAGDRAGTSGASPPLRRRRTRLRRSGRDRGRPRLRRVRVRLSQVALRTSWDGRAVGERARPRAHAADDPVLRRRQLRRVGRGRRAARAPDGPTLTPGGFHSFEHRWALPEAFAFHQSIGRERVEARIRGLASRLKAALAEVRGVRLRTPQSPGLSAGLVCFEVAGRDPARSSRTSRPGASSRASRRTRSATSDSARGS